ncbi:MAG: hypothetical protein ACK4EX_01310 [Thermaurantimonas sp.]
MYTWIKRNLFISSLTEEGITSTLVFVGLAGHCWSTPRCISIGQKRSIRRPLHLRKIGHSGVSGHKIPFANIGYRKISLSKALNDELDRLALSFGHSLTGQSPSVKFGYLINLLYNTSGKK